MEKKSRIEQFMTGLCLAILVFFTVSIAARFFTNKILIDHFGMNNAFTRLIGTKNSSNTETSDDTEISDDTTAPVNINWAQLYPFEGEDKGGDTELPENRESFFHSLSEKTDSFFSLVFSAENKIESYSTKLLVGYHHMVLSAKEYNHMIGWNLAALDPDFDVLRLDNGYLTYTVPYVEEADIAQIADNLADFETYLNQKDIDFYYINAGGKLCPYDKQTSQPYYNYTNENGDHLIAALTERNVTAIDMRDYMIADGLDWYNSYYKTDHHWKTETGFWAAEIISRLLNENSGFSFDDFYFSKSSYKFETYKDYFLGSHGRVVTLAETELEDFTKITPLFETNFSIEQPVYNLEKKGTYTETLFDEAAFLGIANYSNTDYLSKIDAYSCAGIDTSALTVIKNNIAADNRDKKILMLADSFSHYITSYLACDIGEIHNIYLGSFTGSIKSYIEKMQPDVVIMLLNECNITSITKEKYDAHTSLFDFR